MNRAQRRAAWIEQHRHKRRPSVALHIEELTLRGFAGADGDRIGWSATEELTRLISDQGMPSYMNAVTTAPRIDAGRFHVPAAATPGALGAQIARVVYGGPAR